MSEYSSDAHDPQITIPDENAPQPRPEDTGYPLGGCGVVPAIRPQSEAMPQVSFTLGQLLDRPAAVRYAATLRAAGRRLVVTNGCFDLIHVGHVRYLADARALGDALLVGLNSDAGVRALKGPGRPLVSQADRAALLLALRSVDAVVIFDEPTAGPLLQALRPPIYAKGGDYTLADAPGGTRLPEEPVVRAYGGAIHLIPYVEGHSTSALIARIRGQG